MHSSDNEKLFPKLKVVTCFVTSRCNSRCKTCFYWENLNQENDELSIDELVKITASMPPFYHLLLSGGEPFLRNDIDEIVGLFVKNNKIGTVDIPTNGLLTDTIVKKANNILEQNPYINLIIGVSLDGFEKTHNELRGVPNGFKKAVETIRSLCNLKYFLDTSASNRFQVYSLMCISDRNYKELPELMQFIEKEVDIDGIGVEIMRGSPRDSSLQLPPINEIKKITDIAIEINKRLFLKSTPSIAKLKISYIKKVYEIQRSYLRHDKLPLTCQAGVRLAVIEQNGNVKLCELLEAVGNLREYNYDFKKLWTDTKANEQRAFIRDTHCSCTHCVNLGHSIDDDFFARVSRKLSMFTI